MVLTSPIHKKIAPAVPPAMLWLTAGVGLSALPHALHIPIWTFVSFLVLLLLRLFVRPKGGALRFVYTNLFRFVLTAVIFIAVFAGFGTLTGRDAGVTLLVLLAGMKLLEIKTIRDYYITAYIALLLVLTNFFYSQSIFTAVYMGFTLLVVIATLISLNDDGNSLLVQRRLQTAGTLFLHAIPLMLILFIFFPRASGPLWGLPKDAQAGITGIDDEMSPGSISRLVLSDEVAFRVEFHSEIPARSQLYWRGPVLWYTDGYKWVPDKPRQANAGIRPVTDPVSYTVTLEPTDKNWLYALEFPLEAADRSYLSHDMQMRTRRPVTTRRQYQASSYLETVLAREDPATLENALQLPGDYHPETVALARSWRDSGLGDRQIIDRALRYFNEQDFYYTLSPPALQNDTIDEFLFRTRRGFCEHYAAAFVILMRAAGIPARVVTGYQGGFVNPVGNYLIVYQRDAHAWTEVWLGEENGWARVDPTSAVSPARVTDGIEGALPDSVARIPLGLYNNSLAREVWQQLRNTFDAINNRWNQWVLGYDKQRQLRLLSRFGLGDISTRELALALALLAGACFAIVAWGLLRQRRQPGDKARFWYNKFRARLARCGIRIYEHEGPADLADRAARLRRDLAGPVREITGRYIDVRYANHPEKLELLKAKIRAFRPGKRAPV